jgi:hypothetical protein
MNSEKVRIEEKYKNTFTRQELVDLQAFGMGNLGRCLIVGSGDFKGVYVSLDPKGEKYVRKSC